MPRYCAVKVCKNRGGTLPKQEHKRISFYPFPMQDISRLQKWVVNMRRDRWAPSRHQYLCSEHFTEDCFDVRWGIRYLKGAAVPTIFPAVHEESEQKKCRHNLKTPNGKIRTDATDAGLSSSESQLNNRPLILTRTASVTSSTTTASSPPVTDTKLSETDLDCVDYTSACPSTAPLNENLTPNTQDAQGELPDDSGATPALCSAPPSGGGQQPHSGVDSTATLTVAMDTKSPATGLQTGFGFIPMETIVDSVSEDAGHPEEHGGQALVDYDHSYCRGADADREQLWRKILTLHTKVLELDHREENTMASIHALESKIARLRRDGAAFKEKQKLFEDCICTILL